MVGRGSRTQGIQSGHVFCNDSTVLHPEPGFPYLEDREKKVGDDVGPALANSLARNWDNLETTDKKAVGAMFQKNKWQRTKEEFDFQPMGEPLRALLRP